MMTSLPTTSMLPLLAKGSSLPQTRLVGTALGLPLSFSGRSVTRFVASQGCPNYQCLYQKTMTTSNNPNDILYHIAGLAIQVQKILGTDHEEKTYHQMLLSKLRQAGYVVENYPRLKILDDDGKVITTYIPDQRVRCGATQVLVELKASAKGFQECDFRQMRAYLSVSPHDLAVLLLNFGVWPLGKDRAYRFRPGGEA